jgi:hypothetical protein
MFSVKKVARKIAITYVALLTLNLNENCQMKNIARRGKILPIWSPCKINSSEDKQRIKSNVRDALIKIVGTV